MMKIIHDMTTTAQHRGARGKGHAARNCVKTKRKIVEDHENEKALEAKRNEANRYTWLKCYCVVLLLYCIKRCFMLRAFTLWFSLLTAEFTLSQFSRFSQ